MAQHEDPTSRKPSAPTSPLADAVLDGAADAPRATLLDGLVCCPHCRGWIEPDDGRSGQAVACPHCDRPFRMPETVDLGFPAALDGWPLAARRDGAGWSPREPWFYGFIDTYARVWMWLSLLVFGLLVLAGISLCLSQLPALHDAGRPPWIALALPLGIVVLSIPTLLGIMLSVAFMRLAVDVARNLREIRHRDPASPRRPGPA